MIDKKLLALLGENKIFLAQNVRVKPTEIKIFLG